jgi:hypothetical protein
VTSTATTSLSTADLSSERTGRRGVAKPRRTGGTRRPQSRRPQSLPQTRLTAQRLRRAVRRREGVHRVCGVEFLSEPGRMLLDEHDGFEGLIEWPL